ncbi:hypothetical protein ABE424_18255 [Stenotrophomonas sp. TWI1149]|uniref:hypothetical protein n=1 Tax=unclassified Stenotrophomonas TaxID=196198 RepID=UPI00320A8796
MEFMLQLVLLAVLALVATLAVRATIRVRTIPYSRALQRATLAMCADVMANEKNTAKAREYASLIAVFSLSDKVLLSFGRDHKFISDKMEAMHRDGQLGTDAALTDADKKVIQPALQVFAMTCLLHSPAMSREIRRMWEEVTADSYARANSGAPQQSNKAAPPRAEKPVQERIDKVEDEVLERFSDLCHA